MAETAIQSIGKKGGSSVKAISKWLIAILTESKKSYNHRSLLKALKKGVTEGRFKKNKGSYAVSKEYLKKVASKIKAKAKAKAKRLKEKEKVKAAKLKEKQKKRKRAQKDAEKKKKKNKGSGKRVSKEKGTCFVTEGRHFANIHEMLLWENLH